MTAPVGAEAAHHARRLVKSLYNLEGGEFEMVCDLLRDLLLALTIAKGQDPEYYADHLKHVLTLMSLHHKRRLAPTVLPGVRVGTREL
jgi:hypothetical protein